MVPRALAPLQARSHPHCVPSWGPSLDAQSTLSLLADLSSLKHRQDLGPPHATFQGPLILSSGNSLCPGQASPRALRSPHARPRPEEHTGVREAPALGSSVGTTRLKGAQSPTPNPKSTVLRPPAVVPWPSDAPPVGISRKGKGYVSQRGLAQPVRETAQGPPGK